MALTRSSKAKAGKPGATSWDKVSAREAGQTLANRDVHRHQQLDRGKLATRRSARPRMIVAACLGLLVAVLVWIVASMLVMGIARVSSSVGDTGSDSAVSSYYQTDTVSGTNGVPRTCYRLLTADGTTASSQCYPSAKAVPVPTWYTRATARERAHATPAAHTADHEMTLSEHIGTFSWVKLAFSLGMGVLVWVILGGWVTKRVATENLMNDTSDINQHEGDQHLALPEELQRQLDWFPDAGAHSSVQANSMISHMMLANKGLKKVQLTQFAETDVVDQDGNLIYYKGEPLTQADGSVKSRSLPVIDEQFSQELYTVSGIPEGKAGKDLRVCYDTTAIPYNPGDENRDKLRGYRRVSDLINGDWDLPEYEVQRPGGAYLVDTAPVNTMVLAITRAGKGQTYIEPTLDMWSREKKPSNMVINDPKGELLVKNYVPFTRRGFQVVQFNLINAMKTDIYNPLGMAAEAAREGDSTKAALYVENIADVFFPLDGGEDPVWPNAANNAFKRAAYGLIDYYLEEERELRVFAATSGMDPETLESKLDEMWGKVTLYNCYQLFVQLTSKKIKNPAAELEARIKAGEFDGRDEELAAERELVDRQAFLWEGKPEQDMLTLYFNASEALPTNTMRTLIGNAHNALKSMAGAEKMLASVYGIAITAMSFFTDPTIATLTSGTPSQNVDLGGLSFPRRVGVRFAQDYLKRDHLIGQQAVWSAYGDPMFTQDLGEEFAHSDIVSREGWARYFFKGKFPEREAWLKLELVNPSTSMLIRTFYFHFKKGYQVSLNGRHYVSDPVTGEKIVQNGVLRELLPVKDSFGIVVSYKPGDTSFRHQRLAPEEGAETYVPVPVQMRAIMATTVHYSEKPKAVFLVTPPHLMKYAKLILILIKQLVDLNFDKSYMTKPDQKPLYKTRYMLDELGNLQSEGHGIAGFETMLSIGLGQEQQFTLILQTLQQLRDVYGESVDKIVQGNCLPLSAKIAIPDGWTTMGQVEPGDEVLTPFGTVTTVTQKHPVKIRPVYRLTLRDGSSVEACPDHLWPIERWKSSIKYLGGHDEKGKRRYVGGADGKTMERVTEIISTQELQARVEKGRQIDLIAIEPVAYADADLPVDPYVFGAILGDGSISSQGYVRFFSADAEVVRELRQRGYELSEHEVAEGLCPRYGFTGLPGNVMSDLGVAGKRAWEKFIPAVYLRSSVQQRIDLLRGLMDTDGTISKTGEMEFTSCSRELAQGVQELIRSLGGRVAINVKTNIMYTSPDQAEPKAARDAYRVQNIRLPKINPFLLPRKAERWHDRTRGFNRVVSVEYVRDDLVQCIEVADDRHLYLTDDFIPTHNTANIVFLKSTDDAMIETLEKMSGSRHVSYINSKQISQDLEKMVGGKTEGRVSYTMATEKEPLISYNDMAFISPRQSIVFRAGEAPVWNRNETILPMRYKLLGNTITHPGHEYSLQTIPTLSSALDFDVRTNQPDFVKMLKKRLAQAERAEECRAKYQQAYDYSDFDVERLDPDVYSDEVMELICADVAKEAGRSGDGPQLLDPDEYGAMSGLSDEDIMENVEVEQEIAKAMAAKADMDRQVYAQGLVSKSMLITGDGSQAATVLRELAEAYRRARTDLERDTEHFSVGGEGELRSADGTRTYVTLVRTQRLRDELRKYNQYAQSPDSSIYAGDDSVPDTDDLHALSTVKIHPDFSRYLASLPTWEHLAGGEFDRAMAVEMRADD